MPNEELVGAGTGAAKGAAAGAVLGSVVPVIGTSVGAVAGGIIGGVSGLFGGSERKKARRAQRNAVNKGIASQERMFNKSISLQEPWRQAGMESLGTLRTGLRDGRYTMDPSSFGFDESQVQMDPGYQFRLKEGERAIQRSAAARGNLMSGGVMKSLARYGQGLASEEYNRAYNRQYGQATDEYNRRGASLTDRYNRLSGMAGTGQTISSNLGRQAMSHGGNLANLYGQQGNVTAAGHMATAGMMESLPNFALQAGMAYGGLRQPGAVGADSAGAGNLATTGTQTTTGGYFPTTGMGQFGNLNIGGALHGAQRQMGYQAPEFINT